MKMYVGASCDREEFDRVQVAGRTSEARLRNPSLLIHSLDVAALVDGGARSAAPKPRSDVSSKPAGREARFMAAGKSQRWNGEVSTPEDQQSAKRRLLLREAGRAFSEHGFHNTTLDDVAVKLGISKTIFYHYFGNKNDVLKTCVEVGFEIADRALSDVARTKMSGLDKITEFVRLYVEGITSEIGACAVIIEMKSLKADDYKSFLNRQRAFDRKLRQVVQAGIDDGSIDVPDAGVAVSWIMGAPTILARWFKPSGRINAREIADQYAAYARRSLQKN